MFSRRLLLSALLALALPVVAFAQILPSHLDLSRPGWHNTDGSPAYTYSSPATTPPATTVGCNGNNGNVFQTAYSGMYAAPGGAELDLWITGNSLVATVRLQDGRWFEGAATLGPADIALNVPLTSPTGVGGILTLCATHLTVNHCSRLGAAMLIGGVLASGPQIYTRNLTPANSPICVR